MWTLAASESMGLCPSVGVDVSCERVSQWVSVHQSVWTLAASESMGLCPSVGVDVSCE